MATAKKAPEVLAPDQRPITQLQSARLAALTGIEEKSLKGLTVAAIRDRFPWQIDPQLLFFRKVCGKVVKKDPITGIEYPVPFAHVNVEDTDCNLVAYFPKVSKYTWFFPFFCKREVIATAMTDACGNFCVWIPRWEIDWILKWRHERICLPDIFIRPNLEDLVDEVFPRPPFPIPDPPPFIRYNDLNLFEGDVNALATRVGTSSLRQLSTLLATPELGDLSAPRNEALASPAFDTPMPPPLPDDIKLALHDGPEPVRKGAESTFVNTLGAQLGIDVADLRGLDPRRFIGPFRRCFDVLVPEWKMLVDVPDITFRVTQDTNGDGTQETIYGESYFDVRWNAGTIPSLTLHAGPTAKAAPLCDGTLVPCGNQPAIVLAGRLAVNDAAVYNAATGYAIRTNRPRPSGNPAQIPPLNNGTAPFYGVLPLLGCLNNGTGATQYRVVYRYSADGGATFTPTFEPIVGMDWYLHRLELGLPQTHHVVPGAGGWYPINLPAGASEWLPKALVLDWNTYKMPSGKYILKIEVGNGGAATASSPQITFTIDNTSPTGPLSVEWRKAGVGAFQPLAFPCPVIRRGSTPVDLEFRVTCAAASAHLRAVTLAGRGCGSGNMAFVSASSGVFNPVANNVGYWHKNALDNAETIVARFDLSASALQGTYGFGADVSSRAFSPNGTDGGQNLAPQWQYDPKNIYITPSINFSVINLD